MRIWKGCMPVACLLFPFVASGIAQAAPTPVTVDQVFQKAVGKKTFTCGGPIKGLFVPGALDGDAFIPTTSRIADLKKRIKRAKPSQKARLQKQLARALAYQAGAKNTCKSGPAGVTPTPTPSTAPAGCFSATGDTQPGCFNIPSGLSGNKTTGQAGYAQSCLTCHPSLGARTFTQIASALADVNAMKSLSLTQQEIADITAYLNRNSQ